ncbi:unnamed protein product [Rhodiola kirilowii]
MVMPLEMAVWTGKMVWMALSGWVTSCLIVADEIAVSLRNGDIGAFHVG